MKSNLRGPALKMKDVTASGLHTRITIADFKIYRSEVYRESEVQVILHFSVQIRLFSIPPPLLNYTPFYKNSNNQVYKL